MSAPDSQLLAARVAAWHNRHPLAVPVTAQQVRGIGIVAVPFVGEQTPPVPREDRPAEAGASLRQRARAQASDPAFADPAFAHPPLSQHPARPSPAAAARAFDVAFIDGVSSRVAAGLAVRKGSDEDPSRGTWPRHDVAVSQRVGGAAIRWRYLRTAAIETRDRRVRVLVAADDDGGTTIVGRRLYSIPRALTLIAMPCVAAAIVLVAANAPWSSTRNPSDMVAATTDPTVRGAPRSVQGSSAPVAVPSSAGASHGHVPASSAEAALAPSMPGPTAATGAASSARSADVAGAEAAQSTAEVARPVEPTEREKGEQRFTVDIRPRLDPELARRARQESAMARARSPAVAGEVAKAATDAPAGTDDVDKTFALVARATRTRAASLVMLGLMQSTAGEGADTRTEVLPSSGGYRASWWPFRGRLEAETARERLAAVGLPVEIVEF